MEHTNGPWRVAPDLEFARLHPYHENRNIMANDWVICRMTDHAEQRANAQLIAAAPELLDALKVCQVRIFMLEGPENPAYEQARDAIKKARPV